MFFNIDINVARFLRNFERVSVAILAILLVVVIAVLLMNLILTLVTSIDFSAPVAEWVEYKEFRDVFGAFLIVLIGVELMETMRFYLQRNVFRLEVVFTVALVAVVRHVLDIDLQQGSALNLVGTGVLVLALAVGYYLVRKTPKPTISDEPAPEKTDG